MKIYKKVNGKWYRNPGLDIATLEVPTRIKSYGDKQREREFVICLLQRASR